MGANPLKGEVAFPKIAVEGFEKGGIVLLDFNALCALEGELGEKIDEIGGAALKSPQMMRTVMRIALEEHHGAVADKTVGKIIQAVGVDKVSELLLEAFTLSFPEAANATEDPPKPPKQPKPNRATRRAAGTGRGASKRGAK